MRCPSVANLSVFNLLTPDVHGVTDEDFRTVRAYFNDSQVVELTLTVCFFNYFTSEGFNLPLEPWALDTTAKLQMPPADPPLARVGLISDTEMKSTREMQDAMNNPKNPASSGGLGLPIPCAQCFAARKSQPHGATTERLYANPPRSTGKSSCRSRSRSPWLMAVDTVRCTRFSACNA